jgi:MFS family permease
MYFGWLIVVIAALVYMVTIGTTTTAFGLFVVPVSAEFQLSRANMNSALILLNIGSAVLAPIMGRMLDRFSARWIMIACAILFGLSMAGLGLSRSLWLSALILVAPLPAAILGVSTLTMSVLLARWFTARRGRAMVLAAMGMALAAIAVTPIVAWLVAAEGWRAALVIAGGGAAIILLTLAFFVRERPGADEIGVETRTGQAMHAGASASGADVPNAPLAFKSILAMPSFWLIAISVSIAVGMSQAIAITFVPLGLGHGLSMAQATSLLSIAGGSGIVGQLSLSAFADRVERVVLLSCMFALGAVLNAILFVSSAYPMLIVCALMLGMTSGAVAPLLYALVADRFGLASFGTVRGMMTPVIAINAALCVRLAGEVYDRTGGYGALFLIFLVLQLLAAALMFVTRFTRLDRAITIPGT